MKVSARDFIASDKLISSASDIIKNGGVLLSGTDTIYGFGASVFSEKGIEKVRRIKNSPDDKSVLMIIPDRLWIERYFTGAEKPLKRLMEKFWPDNLTLLLPPKPSFPEYVAPGSEFIGVRLVSYKPLVKLMQKMDMPLISTSANISKIPYVHDSGLILSEFEKQVDVIIWEEISQKPPSTVARFKGQEIEIIRQGAVTEDEIKNTL